jgi:UDP-GlcNAc:undecaprenyl-phosphate GlcNAc-1-phosphate transferase
LRNYLLVWAVAGLVTYLTTPLVLRLSRKLGAVDIPDDRKVHAVPTPTLGGVALFLGFCGALAAAASLDAFRSSFLPLSPIAPTELVGIAVSAALIFALGVVDDIKGLKAPAKFSGQLLAAGLVVLSGVRLVYFRFPFVGALTLSPDLQVIFTVFWIVMIVNAVNLIDGLDGLAAGITAIAAGSFFAYSYVLSAQGLAGPEPTAPLISITIVGTTLAFLRYNFNPAKIFMGDSGSMTLGFLLATATVVGVGQSAPENPLSESALFLFYLPLAIPLIVLAVPILDTILAIVRRARRGRHLFQADKEHLHHRLLEIGHGHRQAVLIMYGWASAIAGLMLALSFFPNRVYSYMFGAATVGLFLYTLLPRLTRTEGA